MITKTQADDMHAALDRILNCSDIMYELVNEGQEHKPGCPTRGFGPSHEMNSAACIIRGRLELAGFENPRKGPRKP